MQKKESLPQALLTSGKRRGRPSLKDDEYRGIGITVHLTDAEYMRIVNLADRVGLSGQPKRLVEFIRKCALAQRFNHVPQPNRKALNELGRIGFNINQIAKAANSNLAIDAQLLAKMQADLAAMATQLYVTND